MTISYTTFKQGRTFVLPAFCAVIGQYSVVLVRRRPVIISVFKTVDIHANCKFFMESGYSFCIWARCSAKYGDSFGRIFAPPVSAHVLYRQHRITWLWQQDHYSRSSNDCQCNV